MNRQTITVLATSLLALAACGADSVIGPPSADGTGERPSLAAMSAGGVSTLAVAAATDSTVTVSWTQINDGAGGPADYRVKYAVPSIHWSMADVGCSRVAGTRIGDALSCTVAGLSPGTRYDVQLMSYRVERGVWQNALYSNVAAGTTNVPAASAAGAVQDLAVTVATDSGLTVRWTQVDDGTGRPASYRVKYALPPIGWSSSSATVGCDPTIVGTQIGAEMVCTISGLTSATTYEVQLNAFRVVNGVWQGATRSNVATGTVGDRGMWVSASRLQQLPTSGPAWDQLLSDADRDPGAANISDQDSNHDVYTLAAALVCVRTGQQCTKARNGVLNAMGTESGGRWLAAGRNLTGYVIAADLLDLRADGVAGSAGTRVQAWLAGWLSKRLPDNNTSLLRGFAPFGSGANAAAQEGLAYAAVAAYLKDDWALRRAWDAFRTFACDASAPDRESILLVAPVRDGWAHDDSSPCAINPAGTTKRVPAGASGAGSVRRIDGALVGDMRRGGTYQWMPGYTQYAWVGLEGVVPAAAILTRAGFPAFEVADRAVLRAHEYLWYLRTQTGDARWFDGNRAGEVVHLVNVVYGASFPVAGVVGGGRTVGYTDWTHTQW